MNTSVSRLSRVVDMLDEAYAGPCSIARDPRPSRKVVSTLQVSRFMARQVHDGIPGNAAVGSTPERATPGVYRSGGLRSSRASLWTSIGRYQPSFQGSSVVVWGWRAVIRANIRCPHPEHFAIGRR